MKKPFDLSIWLRQGNQLYKEGKVREARTLFKKTIDAKADYAHAWFMLGALEQREKRLAQAIEALEKAVEFDSGQAAYKVQLAQVYLAADREQEAQALVLEAMPAATQNPKLYLPLGKILAKLQLHEEAKVLFEKALEASPQNPYALNHLGKTLQALEENEEAKQVFLKLMRLSPDLPQPYLNYGHLLQIEGKEEEAFMQYQLALSKRPDWWPAHEGILSSLRKQRRWPEVLQWMKKAEGSGSKLPEYWEFAAQAYSGMKQPAKVAKACKAALSIDAAHKNALMLLATAYSDLGLQEAAIKEIEKLLELIPESSEAWLKKAKMHLPMKEYLAAEEALEKALSLPNPPKDVAYDLVMTRANLFQWENREEDKQLLMDTIDKQLEEEKEGGFIPVLSLNYFDIPPEYHLKAAVHTSKGYAQAAGGLGLPKFNHSPQPKERLKVAYLSPDFRQHAVGILIGDMFKLHNRSKVEVFSYSLVSPPKDDIQKRVKAGSDHFVDAAQMSVGDLASHIYQSGIDILVDLGGYTSYTKTEVMALRPAPVQVHYMGLLDTMGADYIGHIIADEHCITPEMEGLYSEKIWRLPCAFPVSPVKVSAKKTVRSDWGLPDDAVVYACFNANYKLSPDCFQSWMNIMRNVPNSVLWLAVRGEEEIRQTLQQKAGEAGVSAERLIFSTTVPMEEHLERMRHADLFLDTFRFNAGAIGVAALQAGLPLLTLSGNTYASRIGGSLVKAAGISEAVCYSREEFERKGIEWGNNPEKLAGLRGKLKVLQGSCDLFDLPKTVEALEGIYQQMWDNDKTL